MPDKRERNGLRLPFHDDDKCISHQECGNYDKRACRGLPLGCSLFFHKSPLLFDNVAVLPGGNIEVMMPRYPIIEGEDFAVIAEPGEEVRNPEALTKLLLCKRHGEELEEKGGCQFCKECGLMVVSGRRK